MRWFSIIISNPGYAVLKDSACTPDLKRFVLINVLRTFLKHIHRHAFLKKRKINVTIFTFKGHFEAALQKFVAFITP